MKINGLRVTYDRPEKCYKTLSYPEACSRKEDKIQLRPFNFFSFWALKTCSSFGLLNVEIMLQQMVRLLKWCVDRTTHNIEHKKPCHERSGIWTLYQCWSALDRHHSNITCHSVPDGFVCHTMKTYWGSEGTAPRINLGTRWRRVSFTNYSQLLLLQNKFWIEENFRNFGGESAHHNVFSYTTQTSQNGKRGIHPYSATQNFIYSYILHLA
jgi:hypothetical protein